MSPPLRAVGWQPPHVWLTMMESWGLGRQRNSLTRTVQRLRLPGERFPALNSRGTKSWRRKRLLKAAHIHRASHLQGEALKLNCRAFISQFLRWLFYLKKKKKKKGREGGREEGDFSHCCPIGSSPWGWQSKCPGMGPRFLTSKGRKRAATRSGHQAYGGALAAPGACPAGGICQEGRWGQAGEAGGRRPLL